MAGVNFIKNYESGIKGLQKDIESIEADIWQLIKEDASLLKMLNTGEYVWRIPFGEYSDLAAKGKSPTGAES